MPATSNIVDSALLEELQSLLGPTFPQLVATYLQDSKQRMTKLEAAVSIDNYDVISSEAHGLKGSSQNIGATPLAGICAVMEERARDKQAQGLGQLFAELQQEFAAVCRCLEEYT